MEEVGLMFDYQMVENDEKWKRPLTKDSVKVYAMNHYVGAKDSWNLFFQDYKGFLILKRRLNAYVAKQSNNIHSTLNILITLSNVFVKDSLARISFFIAHKETYPALKSYLSFIYRLPYEIPEVDLPIITYDETILEELSKLGLKNYKI